MSKKEAKKPKPKKIQRRENYPKLPVILEFTYTTAFIIVTLSGIITAVTSLLSGSGLVLAITRTCAAIVIVGIVMWIISWIITDGTMKAVSAQAEQMIEEEKLANHTKEVEA
jgi:hypothetical protein